VSTPPTAKDVAEFMAREFNREGRLTQWRAVQDIAKLFGEDFVYTNRNGNPAIVKPVLDEFRRLTENNAIWERSGYYWRRREDRDDPGRRSTKY
jgi:hypothetical protein